MGYFPSLRQRQEAMDMVQAGLSYLAAVDAAQLPAGPRPSACGAWSGPTRSSRQRRPDPVRFMPGRGTRRRGLRPASLADP